MSLFKCIRFSKCFQPDEHQQLKRDQKRANSQIEKAFRQQEKADEDVIKILLLGTGGCGKSTFMKQMLNIEKIGGALKDDPFKKDLEKKWRPIIFNNISDGMNTLVQQMSIFKIAYESETNRQTGEKMKPKKLDHKELITSAKDLVDLWKDSGIQECFKRRAEYQLDDSAPFFFKIMDEVLTTDYVPTIDHVIHAREKTMGAYVNDIPMERKTLRLIDVGGQRGKRSKWLQFFNHVDAVIFVASLAEYDLKLEEDEKTSRHEESIKLFKEIVKKKELQPAAFILFLNKNDLFEEKLDIFQNFQDFFHGFDSTNIEDDEKREHTKQAEFIKRLYKKTYEDNTRRGKSPPFFSNVTCATDTEKTKKVWLMIKNAIYQKVLNSIYE